MSGFIKESFIILVMVLYFDESFTDAKAVTGTIKCVSINNQQCMVRPMLIDLDLDELHYYPFIISMSRCDGSVILLKIHLLEYVFLIKWKT